MSFKKRKQKFISLKEASVLFGYTPDYIGWLIRKGKIPGKKIYSGERWLVSRGAIFEYLKKKKKISQQNRWLNFFFNRKYISLKEAAKISGYTSDYIGYLIRKGEISGKKIYSNVSWLTTEETIKEYQISKIKSQKLKKIPTRPFFSFLIPKYSLVLSILGIVIFSGLVAWAFTLEPSIRIVEIYPSESGPKEIEISWQNHQNALGPPEVGPEDDFDLFSETNSAVYQQGPLSLVLSGFNSFEKLIEKEFISAKIKFSFAIGERITDLILPTIEETIIEPVPEIIPEASPEEKQIEEEPTSFWREIKNFFSLPLIKAKEEEISADARPRQSLPELPEDGPLANEEIPSTEVVTEEILANLDAKIIIWWSFDGQSWQKLATISEYPLSNALNGGYFSYDAPFLKDWNDIKNLKIKFEGVMGEETTVITYLDSVWLEIEYQEKEEEFELRAIKKDWRADETPTFEITPINTNRNTDQHKNFIEKLIAQVSEIFKEKPKVTAELKVPDQEILTLKEGKEFETETLSPTKITIFRPENFRPGKYQLKINFEKKGRIFEFEQDFTWGVLAINTNKSVYVVNKPLNNTNINTKEHEDISGNSSEISGDSWVSNEVAYIQMAVLRDDGHTICDANLKLEIRNPRGETITLSTENGTIQYSGECGANNVTDVPDYFAYYQTGEPGIYQMRLTRLLEDGSLTIDDSFEVRDWVPFDVERVGPTRIYPPAIYEMTLKIKVNQDFNGVIQESVPASFEITNVSVNQIKNPVINGTSDELPNDSSGLAPTINIANREGLSSLLIGNNFESRGPVGNRTPEALVLTRNSNYSGPTAISSYQIINNESNKIIQWQVTWRVGETYELKYQFDAPDVSPYLYLLGPLEFRNKQQGTSDKEQGVIEKIIEKIKEEVGDLFGFQDSSFKFQEARQWQIASDAVGGGAGYYQFTPSSGNLVLGTEQPITSATAAAAEGVNVGSWRGTLADDNFHWVAASTATGIDMQLNLDGVQLNGANKMIIQTEIDLDTTAPALLFQICDWVSSTGVDHSADAQCTGGGWRTLNTKNASQAAIAFTGTSPTALQWHIHDGYWSTGTTGGTPISTPLSNFIRSADGRVKIRYFSTTNTTSLVAIDFLRVMPVIDSVYHPASFTQISGGTPSGHYGLANAIGNTATAQVISSDDLRLAVPGTASVVSDFYLSFRNIKTYTGMNTIYVRAEYSCSTTGINHRPKIWNFNTSAWEDLTTGSIACATADAVNAWAKNNINIAHYVQAGEVRIGWRGLTANALSIQLDSLYVILGSTNTDSAQCEVSFGTGTATGCVNARDLDPTGTSNLWINPSEDESTAFPRSFYPFDTDMDGTVEEAASANLSFPVTPPSNAAVVGAHFAGRFTAGTGLTIQLGLRDYSGLDQVLGGWTAVGTTAAASTALTDSITALTIGTYGRWFNAEDYVDTFNNRMNLRLRTTAAGATTNNASVSWDFAMVSLMWVETTAVITISVSGNAYEDEATTVWSGCDGTTPRISLRVGGVTYGPVACSSATGAFTFSGITPPAAGAVMTIWFDLADTAHCCGSNVNRYSGSGDVTGIAVREERVIVQHDDGGPITNANLDTWDNDNDTDVNFVVTGGALTVEAGNKLIINTGDTFTPGGSVTTVSSSVGADPAGDILISSGATLNMASNALSVGGDYTNSGTFSKTAPQTTTFTATGSGFSITPGTGNFDNLTFNGVGGGWSFSASATIDGDLTMTAGTLSGTVSLTVNGGDVTGDGTINLTGGTFLLDGTGNFGGATSWTFFNLNFGDGVGVATTTATGTGGVIISSVLTISANQTLSAGSKTWTLSGSGTPFIVSGTFNANTSTLRYTASAATNITATTYHNLELLPSANNITFTLGTAAGQTITTNNLTIGNGTNTGTITAATNNSTLDVNGNFTISANATFIASGTATFTVAGNWSNSTAGTFTHSNGTVTFDATATGRTISDGGDPFYNITFNGVGGGWTYQDSSATAPNQTTVTNGTALFLNAKTGTVSVGTGGTLYVDWYLGIHVVNAANTADDIDTQVNAITISEAGGNATVWRYTGADWGTAASSQTTDTDTSGKNPQLPNAGAIRIREYLNSSGTYTLYRYNLRIDWVTFGGTNYGEYDYYADYGGRYLTSCLANTSACSDDTANDDTIGSGWHRVTPGLMNGTKPYDGVNNPPTQGSWFVGILTGLSVTLSATSVDLGELNATNNFTSTSGTTTITVTTSATNGYIVTAWALNNGRLQHQNFPTIYIDAWTGTNATPTNWDGNCPNNTECGFGYNTNDGSLSGGGADRFVNATNCGADNKCWARFATVGPGDPVADRTGPSNAQSNIITYKVSVSTTQRAGPYQTIVIFVTTANY